MGCAASCNREAGAYAPAAPMPSPVESACQQGETAMTSDCDGCINTKPLRPGGTSGGRPGSVPVERHGRALWKRVHLPGEQALHGLLCALGDGARGPARRARWPDDDRPLVHQRRTQRAAAGNAGSFGMSRGSCWMMKVALRFFWICLMRSIDASVWARSKLKPGTPGFS